MCHNVGSYCAGMMGDHAIFYKSCCSLFTKQLLLQTSRIPPPPSSPFL